MTKHEQRVHAFAAVKGGTVEKYFTLHIVRHDMCVAVWTHQTKRPSYYYKFKTEQEIQDFIARRKESVDIQRKQSDQWREKIKQENDTIYEGAIMYDSWGWEQTNIDFYKVVRRSESTVWLQKLKAITQETGFMSGNTRPTDEVDGPVFTRRIGRYGVRIENHRGCLSLYDGQPKSCSWYA